MTDQPIEQNKQLEIIDTEQNTCTNCHTPLEGPYCSHCGQEVNSTLKYFGTVILHLLEDIFSFDSRAKRTLIPLLTKPGYLTQEYFDGKRVLYVPPLRLYLFISIIFFISLKFFTPTAVPDFGRPGTEVVVADLQEKITELESTISTKNKSSLEANTTQSPHLNPEEKAAQTAQAIQLAELKSYLSDIEKLKNTQLKLSTITLAYLTLEQIKNEQPLTEKQLDFIEDTKHELDMNNKVKPEDEANGITIGNDKEGNINFDFLSVQTNKMLNERAEILVEKANEAIRTDPSLLIQQAISKLPQMMFILLPVFAFFLKIMFIFSNRLYMEHLTVALHSHSFIFLTILLLEILDKVKELSEVAIPILSGITSVFSVLLAIWLPIYLFLMQKRIYRQGVIMALFKYMIISSVYMILIVFTTFIAFVWGLTDI